MRSSGRTPLDILPRIRCYEQDRTRGRRILAESAARQFSARMYPVPMSQGKTPDPLPDVLRHYQQVEEDTRLKSRWCQLELVRTQELILRHLPAAPANVIDVGGGSGVYACWLAGLGYDVQLIDPVPRHIEQALANSVRQQRPIVSMRVGDARRLEFDDRSAHAMLLLGPLYHLPDRSDRITSLRKAYRVLHPGGVVFAAAISHFASLMDSLLHGFFDKPEFAPILEGDLKDGQHRNPTGNPDYFATAFFHRPDELRAELEEAGFRVLELAAVEGPAWITRDFDRLWADQVQRTRLLDSIRKVEHEPALLGASPHLLAIGKK